MANLAGEKRYEQVFGDTFALYTHDDMLEFIEPFKVRFTRNGLDARQLFAGKRCFDAACGNRRGALFMLMNGASHVTACDFSAKNVASARAFLKQFGFDNAEVFESSLESIPRPDESFDFVWCNGVLMHTACPNRCLNEIARILRRAVGPGSTYTARAEFTGRTMVREIPVPECMAALQLLRYETRYVAEFIDDWFATHLRCYTRQDFGAALSAAGFAPTDPLLYGTAYDTSQRRSVFGGEELDLMGEGDLRYLLEKTDRTPPQPRELLNEGEYGSEVQWAEIIMRALDPALAGLAVACPHPWQRVAAAAHVQRELRLQMSQPVRFDLATYLHTIERVKEFASRSGEL